MLNAMMARPLEGPEVDISTNAPASRPPERTQQDPATVAPPAVLAGDATVELAIRRLNRLCRRATLAFTLEVGRVVIDELYRGDLTCWRSRKRKSTPLRKLAQHPDLPMSPSSLFRCIAIYEVWVRLGTPNAWKHVSTCHVRAVLRCPLEVQEELLRNVEEQRWPVARLEQEVAAICPSDGAAPAARPPRLHHTIRWIERYVDDSGMLLGAHDLAASLEPAKAMELIERVARIRRACERLEGELRGNGVGDKSRVD